MWWFKGAAAGAALQPSVHGVAGFSDHRNSAHSIGFVSLIIDAA
ncbi:MAG: hypothetical protein ACI9GK_002094 [Devosia sp.]|jgi:hypothetical protein